MTLIYFRARDGNEIRGDTGTLIPWDISSATIIKWLVMIEQ